MRWLKHSARIVSLCVLALLIFTSMVSVAPLAAEPTSAALGSTAAVAALPSEASSTADALPAASSLDGTVHFANGMPAAGLHVLALADGNPIATAEVDATGHFALGMLTPGRYAFQVYAGNRSFMIDSGTMLWLEADQAQTVAIRLAPVDDEPAPADAAGAAEAAPASAPVAPVSPAVDLAQTGSLSGRVTSASSSEPLDRVSVRLYNAAGQSYRQATTNVSGLYTLTNLAAGDYRVYFDSGFSTNSETKRHLSEYYNQKPDLASATPVTVGADAAVANINAALQRGGELSGRATDAVTGAGLQGVMVRLFAPGAEFASTSMLTDGSGFFTFTRLISGSYRVQFDPRSGTTNTHYVGQYYNNKSDLASADEIAVATGQQRTGINAQLVAGATLRGTVSGGAGAGPLDRVVVAVYDECGLSVATDYTGSDGIYEIGGLPAGVYRVGFWADYSGSAATRAYLNAYYEGKANLREANPITITTGGTATVDATLTKGAQIGGRVVNGAGEPISGISVGFYANGVWQASTSTDNEGNYLSRGLPAGSYEVRFAQRNDYLAQRHPEAVVVTAGQVVNNINATLARSGSITGRVTGVGDVPLPGIEVRTYGENGALLWEATTLTDANGAYTITNALASGFYRLHFAPGSSATGEVRSYAPRFNNNRMLQGRSEFVVVEAPNATNNVDVTLVRGGTITGKVVDAENAPISGATVSVRDLNARTLVSATTDSNGVYTITGLLPNFYQVRFGRSGYESQYYNGQTRASMANVVRVSGTNVVADINAQLTLSPGVVSPETGAVSGRVTAEGCPLPGVQVIASVGASSSTNTQGLYTIRNIPAGDYTLSFRGNSLGFLDEFYDNVAQSSAATTVTVRVNTTTQNINAELVGGTSINGQVTGPGGAGVAGVQVSVYAAEAENSQVIHSTRTKADGSYSTLGLAPGSYKLFFTPPQPVGNQAGLLSQWYNAQASRSTATPVAVVAGQPTNDVNVALAAGYQISGKVEGVQPNGNKWPLANVNVVIFDQDGRIVATTNTEADGSYVSRVLAPGAYRVHFRPRPNTFGAFFVPRFYNNKRRLSEADVVTVSNANVPNISAELRRGRVLAGRVRLPASFATTQLAAEDATFSFAGVAVRVLDGEGNQLEGYEATTDSNGYFVVSPALEPGTYRLAFTPPSILNLLSSTSAPITVEAEGAEIIDLSQDLTLEAGFRIFLPLTVR